MHIIYLINSHSQAYVELYGYGHRHVHIDILATTRKSGLRVYQILQASRFQEYHSLYESMFSDFDFFF